MQEGSLQLDLPWRKDGRMVLSTSTFPSQLLFFSSFASSQRV